MDLATLMSNAVIAELILKNTPAEALASFSQVDRNAKQHAEAYYAHVFRCLLAKYFDRVDGFIAMLKEVKGCITGSEALKLLINDCHANWEAKDMDISVPCGAACTICSYLQTFEGYAPMDDSEWKTERLAYHQLLKRQRLKNVCKLKGKHGHCIDVLESCTADCIAPLCDFHSTAVINALFPDKLTCFFPAQTLRYRSIPNANFQRFRDKRAVSKYTGRAVGGVEGSIRGRNPEYKELEYLCAFCQHKHKRVDGSANEASRAKSAERCSEAHTRAI